MTLVNIADSYMIVLMELHLQVTLDIKSPEATRKGLTHRRRDDSNAGATNAVKEDSSENRLSVAIHVFMA